MYIIPAEYKCPKCKRAWLFSPDNAHPAPVIDGDPVCPYCYKEWVRANLPIMRPLRSLQEDEPESEEGILDWKMRSQMPKPVRLQIVSDLHLDLCLYPMLQLKKISAVPSFADALVIAGDLAEFQDPLWSKAIHYLCSRYKKVIFVAGNHEYYSTNPESVDLSLQRTHELQGLENFVYLENSTVEIRGVRIAGSTLWFRDQADNHRYEPLLNDFRYIQAFKPWVYEKNAAALEFLANVEADVVVTHHLPTGRSVAKEYKGSPLNRFFLCEVEDLVDKIQPQYWIHGHSHKSCDYVVPSTVGGQSTRVVCNPKGYRGEDTGFEDVNIVEVVLSITPTFLEVGE